MKKLFLFFVLIISVSNLAFAQNEVRGIETKLVKYDGKSTYIIKTGNSTETEYNLWYGFQFTNLNSIPVSIDAELYNIDGKLITTKTFVIMSKEAYIWKFENNNDFRVYYDKFGYYTQRYYRYENEPEDNYYVKYKAFKLE